MLGRAQRLEVIPAVEHCNSVFTRSIPCGLNDGFEAISSNLYQIHEFTNKSLEEGNTVYQLPYLFELDGSPWVEANLFLLNAAKASTLILSANDKLRRMAWTLLDYKIFCEAQSVKLFDFSALRPVNRPTYRYFKSLLERDDLSGRVLNQKTKVIYDFYKYVHEKGGQKFIMERVDVTKAISLFIKTKNGFVQKKVLKRSQTVPTPSSQPVTVGFVRDEGEELRPLVGEEFNSLIGVLEGPVLSLEQRLMVWFALLTGERKQTILTLRIHHLEQFNESNLGKDDMYRLKVSPNNGADTKYSKPHLLYVPKFLAEMMIRYSKCDAYLSLVAKFREAHGNILQGGEMYLFLTREGNCHYMAKNDPRYLKVRTRPTGGNTKTITDNIIAAAGLGFPEDFSFHWLRATFAHQMYGRLRPLVASGQMIHGNDVTFIQKRLHHSHRETTEGYLKLFSTVDERLIAQEEYESTMFSSYILQVTRQLTGSFNG
ncbi:site-specific integrase [Shewanella sp. UCD-KL12]|uniref:site-specific integrase n=1 Tax=Shewanella sp. UCD-KL12 TaxID=1917163 RepID=UPI0009F8B6E1|nr:site-specific integrase [Shewanella sp. UCD-KL12]